MLYAVDPDDIPPSFFSWVAAHAHAFVVLVVDHCDARNLQRLRQQAELANGRLRLVTVGEERPLPSLSATPVFDIPTLADDALYHVVDHVALSLPQGAKRLIARLSSGNIKLAVQLGLAVAQHPQTLRSLYDIRQSSDVQRIVGVLLPDAQQLRVLHSLALVTRAAVYGVGPTDSAALADLTGMSLDEWLSTLHDLEIRGLVAKQGRYRYVTPDLLAIWLAADIWEQRSSDILTRLLPDLTDDGKQALMERIPDLADQPHAVRFAEAAVRDALSDLSRLRNARLVGQLIQAVPPRRAARLLKDALGGLAREELRDVNGYGRREIVSALERLLWFRDSFADAARLLLRLADAENETWANNATGTWLGLFHTHLSATSVPVQDRLGLIDEALAAPAPRFRHLAVDALIMSLSLFEARTIGSEDQGGRIVPDQWRPTTIGDDQAVRRAVLDCLDTARQDPDKDVAQRAEKVLLDSARAMVQLGLYDDIMPRLLRLPQNTGQQKFELRQRLEWILEFDQEHLSEPQISAVHAKITSLTGSSFSERLRHWTGRRSLTDHRRDDESMTSGGIPPTVHEAIKLADDVFEQRATLSTDDWHWLTSLDAENVWSFSQHVGERDETNIWLPQILEHASDDSNPLLLAGYLSGRAPHEDDGWVDDILDHLVEDRPDLPRLIATATLNITPSERGAQRLAMLAEQGRISASGLASLSWREWPSIVSIDTFHTIANIASTDLDEASIGDSVIDVCGCIDPCAANQSSTL